LLTTGRFDSLILYFTGGSNRNMTVVANLRIQGAEPAITGSSLQINYEEALASTRSRFGSWLDRVIVEGLNAWRLTL